MYQWSQKPFLSHWANLPGIQPIGWSILLSPQVVVLDAGRVAEEAGVTRQSGWSALDSSHWSANKVQLVYPAALSQDALVVQTWWLRNPFGHLLVAATVWKSFEFMASLSTVPGSTQKVGSKDRWYFQAHLGRKLRVLMNGTGIYRNHIRQRFSSLWSRAQLMPTWVWTRLSFLGRAIYFYLFFFCGSFFFGSWLYAFLFLWFSASLLFCFSCFSCFSAFPASLLFLLLCFSCFSAFPASLLFCFSAFCFPCFSAFPASRLFCFSVFPASLLLYFCAFLLLLFYFFFSSVMCFCCSTSCSFASLLPVFTVSLFFSFFCFILFCLYPKWNPRETLGETQRKPKELLIRNPTWSPKWTLKKP